MGEPVPLLELGWVGLYALAPEGLAAELVEAVDYYVAKALAAFY